MAPNVYSDDQMVATLTRDLVARGERIFQIFKLAADDGEHVAALLRLLNPPASAKVLDAGCGVGEVARLMKAQRPDLEIALLNISPAQLAMCPPEFDRIAGDIGAMPIEAGSFDVVLICYALGHADASQAIAEAARVLRPGGVLFVYDLANGGPALREVLHYDAWRREDIEAAARDCGFSGGALSLSPVSTDHCRHMIAPEAFDAVFAGVSPVAFRFVR